MGSKKMDFLPLLLAVNCSIFFIPFSFSETPSKTFEVTVYAAVKPMKPIAIHLKPCCNMKYQCFNCYKALQDMTNVLFQTHKRLILYLLFFFTNMML